jgi:hypothetical protein
MAELFTFDQGDLGKIFPDAKKFLESGKVIIVHGVSEAVVDSGEYDVPARSLFWNLPTDEGAFDGNDYWGLLLAENSLPIRDTLKMVERGRTPFPARISRVAKLNVKGQAYWVLKRAEIRFDSDGTFVDPNDAA